MKTDRHFLVDYFVFSCTHRGQTGWWGESLERLSEELRAWILKQGHFPTIFHSIHIFRQQDKYFLCPAPAQYIEYKIYVVIRALDAAWCPEALNKAGYPWKVFTARGAWVGDTMLRWWGWWGWPASTTPPWHNTTMCFSLKPDWSQVKRILTNKSILD